MPVQLFQAMAEMPQHQSDYLLRNASLFTTVASHQQQRLMVHDDAISAPHNFTSSSNTSRLLSTRSFFSPIYTSAWMLLPLVISLVWILFARRFWKSMRSWSYDCEFNQHAAVVKEEKHEKVDIKQEINSRHPPRIEVVLPSPSSPPPSVITLTLPSPACSPQHIDPHMITIGTPTPTCTPAIKPIPVYQYKSPRQQHHELQQDEPQHNAPAQANAFLQFHDLAAKMLTPVEEDITPSPTPTPTPTPSPSPLNVFTVQSVIPSVESGSNKNSNDSTQQSNSSFLSTLKHRFGHAIHPHSHDSSSSSYPPTPTNSPVESSHHLVVPTDQRRLSHDPDWLSAKWSELNAKWSELKASKSKNTTSASTSASSMESTTMPTSDQIRVGTQAQPRRPNRLIKL